MSGGQKVIIYALVVLGAIGLLELGAIALLQTQLGQQIHLPVEIVSLTTLDVTAVAGIGGFLGHQETVANVVAAAVPNWSMAVAAGAVSPNPPPASGPVPAESGMSGSGANVPALPAVTKLSREGRNP